MEFVSDNGGEEHNLCTCASYSPLSPERMLILRQSTTTLRSPIWNFGVEKPSLPISITLITTEASIMRYVPPCPPPRLWLKTFLSDWGIVCINSAGAMRTCTRSVRHSSRARNVSTSSTRSGIRITSTRTAPLVILGAAAGARVTLTPRTTSVRTTNSDSSARPGADWFFFFFCFVRLFRTFVLAKVGPVGGTPIADSDGVVMTTAATSIN